MVSDPCYQRVSVDDAPAAVIALVQQLMPALLQGTHPALSALREQYQRATLSSVDLTGVGFYANFAVPPDVPMTVPESFSGGDAVVMLDTAPVPGGCVLHVRDGWLDSLEVYTFDGVFAENTKVLGVEDVTPILAG